LGVDAVPQEVVVVRRLVSTVIVLFLGAGAAFAQAPAAPAAETRTLNLTTYAELLRSDVRGLKVAILTEVMGFTVEEDAKFWPIYREYDAEMTALSDERMAMIADYAANYDTLTDDVAARLAAKAIDLEAKRHAAKARCYEKVKAALSPKTALRFGQVEHQLQLIIDLQISASLPVAQ
jgi:predicted GH43/DUF377 family glycosyl hydrolase